MRLHLVDGTYELYRAHYAPRPDYREPSGMDAKATVGIVESLLALLHDPQEAVTHIAVAFDNPIRSFRNDLFPPYKSDEGVPPELRAQFDKVWDQLNKIRKLDKKVENQTVEEGFGRLDALNRIGNQVFAIALRNDANYTGTSAPVHFPRIWDSSWFD